MTDRAVRRRTCVHEAGHAVAQIVLGGPDDLQYVSIRPGRTFGGISVAPPRKLPAVDRFDGFRSVSVELPELRAGVERRIIVALAGGIAALYLGPRDAGTYLEDQEREGATPDVVGEHFSRP